VDARGESRWLIFPPVGFGDRGYKRDVRVPSRYDWDRFFVCVLTRAQATLGRNFSIAFVTDMPSLRDVKSCVEIKIQRWNSSGAHLAKIRWTGPRLRG